MPELQVIARHTIAAGREAEALSLYEQLIDASRAEPGNVSYVAYRELGDERRIVLLERYASRQAFDAHRTSPHFKELVLERIVPLLEDRTVEVLEAPEG